MSSWVMAHRLSGSRLALKPGLAKGAAMRRAILACALALGLASNGPVAAQSETITRVPAPARARALAPADASKAPIAIGVFAHPDDELVVAPALAALVREGYDVRLIYATDGDQGPGVSDFPPGAELGRERFVEAACASIALGVYTLIPLGLGDGTLGVKAHQPGSSANALREALGPHLADATMIITWGPDGGYGHADHRMVSAMTTQIVQAASAATRPKLFYVGIPSGSLPPVPEMARWATTDPALLTETIAYTPADLEAAKAAAQCHVTQFDETTRAGMMPLFNATIWRGRVHFRPAF